MLPDAQLPPSQSVIVELMDKAVIVTDADVSPLLCIQAAQRDQAQQGMLELVVEELLRDADAGVELALRWLTALAVAHCRPRAPPPSSAAGGAGDELGRDTDMADIAADAALGAEDSSRKKMNGVPSHRAAAEAADGAPQAAASPKDPRGPPVGLKPSKAASEAGTEGAASTAGVAQPWGGLAGSPYEAALLALVKACRWREESLSDAQSGRSSFSSSVLPGSGDYVTVELPFIKQKVPRRNVCESEQVGHLHSFTGIATRKHQPKTSQTAAR